jgi:hypothetical protein
MAGDGTSTFWVALYGAVLSTVLAASKLLSDRPIVVIKPAEVSSTPPYVLLGIQNPSRRPLFIDGHRQIRLSGPRHDYGVIAVVPLNSQEDIGREFARAGRRPFLYVPPEGTATLRIGGIVDNSSRVIVIWWHHNWWPLFRLPAFARVTSDLAKEINPQ